MRQTTWLIASFLVFGLAPVANAAVPGQFIAKMYTEVLGRAPDAGGWQYYLGFFTQNGCSQATLKSAGQGVYLSSPWWKSGAPVRAARNTRNWPISDWSPR